MSNDRTDSALRRLNPVRNGFTLVELMIVVAIVAVLAAIAIPSYQSSIMKSRRADAQGALQQFRQAMERHYTKTYSYQGAGAAGDTGTPTIFAAQSPVEGGQGFYALSIDASTATTFTISATPIIGTGQENDGCGTLTLTNSGVRTSGGAAGVRCWED